MPSSETPSKKALAIVMPFYNEEASLPYTLHDWLQKLDQVFGKNNDSYTFLAIDDRSTDNSCKIAQEFAARHSQLHLTQNKQNLGHGQTCLAGYKQACQLAKWVLQIDSDGQCNPDYFPAFWDARETYDVIQGIRTIRLDGNHRWLASRILEIVTQYATGTKTSDPNCPYRLMRCNTISSALEQIPLYFQITNVALTTLLKRQAEIQHTYIPITFQKRHGGSPKVSPLSLFKKLFQFYQQAKHL